MIAGPLILILLFTLLFSSVWTLWFLSEKQKTQKLCYNHNLKAQKILIETGKSLLRLNKKVWPLIYEKRFLNQLILFGPPQAKVAAQIKKKAVIAQQKLLRIQQQSILHLGNLRSRRQVHLLNNQLKKQLKKTATFWQDNSVRIHTRLLWQPAQVQPQFKEIAPPYQRVSNYSSKQRLQIQWKVLWKKIRKRDWYSYVSNFSNWQGSCSTQPYKKGNLWLANISPDKF